MRRPKSMRAHANSVPCIHLHSLPPTTERAHLRTVLPPLSPGFRGRGVGGEGAIRVALASGPNLRTWPRVPTLAPSGRERVFDGAAPSSPALLPREDRGRRGPEGFNRDGRCCHCERNESGLRHLIRFISPPLFVGPSGRANRTYRASWRMVLVEVRTAHEQHTCLSDAEWQSKYWPSVLSTSGPVRHGGSNPPG